MTSISNQIPLQSCALFDFLFIIQRQCKRIIGDLKTFWIILFLDLLINLQFTSSVDSDRLAMTKFGFGGFFHFSNSAIFFARSFCLLSSSSDFCRRFASYNHSNRNLTTAFLSKTYYIILWDTNISPIEYNMPSASLWITMTCSYIIK